MSTFDLTEATRALDECTEGTSFFAGGPGGDAQAVSADERRRVEGRIDEICTRFDTVSNIDAEAHAALFRDEIPEQATVFQSLKRAYQALAIAAREVLDKLAEPPYERLSFEGTDRLRQIESEVQGMFTTDEEFFGDEYQELEERAFESYRGGESEEFEEMDD